MRVIVLSLAAAPLLLLNTGCVKANPAKTKVYIPGASIEYHCPPGQRKKGQC